MKNVNYNLEGVIHQVTHQDAPYFRATILHECSTKVRTISSKSTIYPILNGKFQTLHLAQQPDRSQRQPHRANQKCHDQQNHSILWGIGNKHSHAKQSNYSAEQTKSVKDRRFRALPHHSTYRITSSQTGYYLINQHCAQTFYRLRTCRTYPKIVSGLAFAFGIGDQRCDQLQDVLFAMDIGERVIVH